MLTRIRYLPVLIAFLALAGPVANVAPAQNSIGEFQKILHDRAAFDATDFAALEEGQAIVRRSSVTDKREVAVCGLVGLNLGADDFLKLYREGMVWKNNPAVLEIGRFSSAPGLADLQALTIERRDIEDLKECVVGDCRLKLSAPMIERFRTDVNWQAPDYRAQATQLLKLMLLDYVRDYLARGETALIEYNDKRNEVRLADEQRALAAASGYLSEFFADPELKSGVHLVEDAIVWSKIKFGLKPVIVINHIKIYKRDRDVGPQVLIASRQIYANHYFNSSLGLTAFVSVPGASPGAYLVYENRSRADGLEGAFSRIKRRIVENKAVEGLQAILERSKLSLEAATLNPAGPTVASHRAKGWGRRLFGGIRPFLWLVMISALLALLALGNYEWKSARPKERSVETRT